MRRSLQRARGEQTSPESGFTTSLYGLDEIILMIAAK
jgi:hypothetical protein